MSHTSNPIDFVSVFLKAIKNAVHLLNCRYKIRRDFLTPSALNLAQTVKLVSRLRSYTANQIVLDDS